MPSIRIDHQPAGYRYSFPPSAVALTPTRPRDRAKLLVLRRDGNIAGETTFQHLDKVLPPRAVIVFNQTKVIPARFRVLKPTGGRVELLCLTFGAKTFTALADRRLDVGTVLTLAPKRVITVIARTGRVYTLRPSMTMATVRRLVQKNGTTPLPPYLRHSPLTESERRRWYQAVFATDEGSVAAPTASLHFTPRLIRRLTKRGVDVEYLTLHVGLGTFAPLTVEHLHHGRLHHEPYMISTRTAARLNRLKKSGRPIIAVGTTVARALESATASGVVRPGSSSTDLFIRPGYRWKFVDGLITNFHVPESSLLMLVAALVGRKNILAAYERAIGHGFKLFSFGDGMFIS